MVRTTIRIDDRLLAQLRKRAADSGTSVSRLIEDAVRVLLQTTKDAKHPAPFELVTFGRGGRFSRKNIDRTSRLIEDDEVDRHHDHD